MNIQQYWTDVLQQNGAAMKTYFHPDAQIRWHNTNELFTVSEFIRANCEYPGDWDGEVEQIIQTATHIVTAVHVFTRDQMHHFHVASFIHLERDLIRSLDEYWGDDGPAPQWRQELGIGTRITGEKQ